MLASKKMLHRKFKVKIIPEYILTNIYDTI